MAPAKKQAARKPGSGKRSMSDAHKHALAEGRAQGRAVRAYLEALETHKPKRGRKRTPDSITRRLQRIEQELPGADPMKRLALTQERLDLERELTSLQDGVDLTALEADFIAHAKAYSDNKGITYAAWRTIGVPAPVLASAGIPR
jgi:hypothetical protein